MSKSDSLNDAKVADCENNNDITHVTSENVSTSPDTIVLSTVANYIASPGSTSSEEKPQEATQITSSYWQGFLSYLYGTKPASDREKSPVTISSTETSSQTDIKDTPVSNSEMKVYESGSRGNISFFSKLWSIFSFGSSNEDIRQKITTLPEINALPDNDQQRIEEILKESVRASLSSEETLERLANEIVIPTAGDEGQHVKPDVYID